MIKDQLSWRNFLKVPKNKKINKVEPFNRLIAHSAFICILDMVHLQRISHSNRKRLSSIFWSY